jgi:hypothetical protein
MKEMFLKLFRENKNEPAPVEVIPNSESKKNPQSTDKKSNRNESAESHSKEHSKEVRYDNVYNFFAYVKEISERNQRLRRPKLEIDKFSCLHGRDKETGIQLLDRKSRLSSFYNSVSYSNLNKVKQDYKDYL